MACRRHSLLGAAASADQGMQQNFLPQRGWPLSGSCPWEQAFITPNLLCPPNCRAVRQVLGGQRQNRLWLSQQNGNLGGRPLDGGSRRLCSRNQSKVWAFKLPLWWMWLLTDHIFGSKGLSPTSSACRERVDLAVPLCGRRQWLPHNGILQKGCGSLRGIRHAR